MKPEHMTHQEHLVRRLERQRRYWSDQSQAALINLLVIMALILGTVIASAGTYTTPRILLLAAFGTLWLQQANRKMLASAMLAVTLIAQEELADDND